MRSRLVLALIVAFAVAVGAVPGARTTEAAQPSQGDLARVIAIQERHTPQLMRVPGVVGTAVGLADTGRLAVLILTERESVPGLPQTLDSVPAVVRVTGRIVALDHRGVPHGKPGGGGGGGGGGSTPSCTTSTTDWNRPACVGESVGHYQITAGTIGARARANNSAYLVSNNHVLAKTNCGSTTTVSDPLVISGPCIGDPILQPGPYDGGTIANHQIGGLHAYVPIKFGGADNTVDAAIASLLDGADLSNSTSSAGYGTPKSTLTDAALDMPVMKMGRTTGLTRASVSAVNATVNVNYGDVDGIGTNDVAKFVNQIVVFKPRFSAGGDSGSLVVVDGGIHDKKPVGLLFAGSSTSTIINPINDVVTKLSITIDGEP